MNEQQLIMIPNTIPGVICQFCARGSGEIGPGRTLAGTTGTREIIFDDDGRVPDAPPESHCLTGNRTIKENLIVIVAEWTAGYGDEKNAGSVFPNAGIIIRKPGGT
jgi:hypothetical protein